VQDQPLSPYQQQMLADQHAQQAQQQGGVELQALEGEGAPMPWRHASAPPPVDQPYVLASQPEPPKRIDNGAEGHSAD